MKLQNREKRIPLAEGNLHSSPQDPCTTGIAGITGREGPFHNTETWNHWPIHQNVTGLVGRPTTWPMVRQLDRQPLGPSGGTCWSCNARCMLASPRYGPSPQFGATWASVAVARVTRLRAATGAGNRGRRRPRKGSRTCRPLAPGTAWHVRRVRMRHPSPSSSVPSHLPSSASASVSGGVLTRHRTCCGKPVLRPDRRVG